MIVLAENLGIIYLLYMNTIAATSIAFPFFWLYLLRYF